MNTPIRSSFARPDTRRSLPESGRSKGRPTLFGFDPRPWLSSALGRAFLRLLFRLGLREPSQSLSISHRLSRYTKCASYSSAVISHLSRFVLAILCHLMPSYTTNTVINLLMPSNAGENNAKENNAQDNRGHDGGDDEGTGRGEESQKDSDGSRSGQDNRERILQEQSGSIDAIGSCR